MISSFRRLLLAMSVALALVAFSGCSQNEHRKVQVIEEQHEGEVVEEAPGEMIVE